MPPRQLACAVCLAGLVAPLSAAAQTLDTVRFGASGIAVSLVLRDRGALPLRTEAERLLRAGLDEFTGMFDDPPRAAEGAPALTLTVNLSTRVANEGDSDPGILTVVAGERPVFGFYSDLVGGLKARSGIDYSSFMARYVDGTATLPLRDYLDLGDIALGMYRQLALDTLAAQGERPAVQLPPLDPALAAAIGLPTRRPL